MLWLREIKPGALIVSLGTGRRYRIAGCREADPFPEIYIEGADGDHRGDGWTPLVILQEGFEKEKEETDGD